MRNIYRFRLHPLTSAVLLALSASSPQVFAVSCPATIDSNTSPLIQTCDMASGQSLLVSATGSVGLSSSGNAAIVVPAALSAGSITNQGQLFGNLLGISLLSGSSTGNILNQGTITAATGINLDEAGAGNITNAGTGVISATQNGISISSNTTTTTVGSVSNVGTINVSGAEQFAGSGINVGATFPRLTMGGISNAGQITITGVDTHGISSDANGIALNRDPVLTGGISNTAQGSISVQSNVNLRNAALIDLGSTSASANGIGAFGYGAGMIAGSITNDGSITAAVQIDESNPNGLTSGTTFDAFAGVFGINVDSWNGVQDVTNSGTLTATATIQTGSGTGGLNFNNQATAVGLIANGLPAAANISNTGTITTTATSSDGIAQVVGLFVASSALSGNLTNTGNITASASVESGNGASAYGIVLANMTMGGNLINSGSVSALTSNGSATKAGIGLAFMSGSQVSGSLQNDLNASIRGDQIGIQIDSTSGITGGIDNRGTIHGGTTALDLANTTPFTITNRGTLSGNVNLGVNTLTILSTGAISNGNVVGTLSGATGVVNIGDTSGNTADFTAQGNFTGLSAFNINTGSTLHSYNALSIDASTITNSGTLSVAAGHTVSINGAYTQTGTYQWGAITNAIGGYGVVNVTGAATLTGSTFAIKPGSNLAIGTYSGILSATSLTGGNSLAGGTYYNLAYAIVPETGDANILDLVVTRSLNPTPLLSGGQANAVIQLATESLSVLHDRANRMSGKSYEGTSVDNHIWIAPYGSQGDQNGNGTVDGYSHRTAGIAFGADNNYSGDWRLGAALSFGHSDVSGDNTTNVDRLRINSYQVASYAKGKIRDMVDLTFIASLATDRSSTSRNDTTASTLPVTATADYSGWHGTAGIEVAHSYPLNEKQTITPKIGVDYIHAHVNGYTDSDSLKVEKQTANALVFSTGGEYVYAFDGGGRFIANVGIRYDTMAEQSTITSTLNGGAPYTTTGINPGHTAYQGGIGYEVLRDKGATILIKYDTYKRSGYFSNMASVNVKVPF